jgi:hypothetical protein
MDVVIDIPKIRNKEIIYFFNVKGVINHYK